VVVLGERLTLIQFLLILTSVTGVVLVVNPQMITELFYGTSEQVSAYEKFNLFGVVVGLLSAMLIGVSQVFLRKVGKLMTSMQSTFYFSFIGLFVNAFVIFNR
jgi:drug/metabolite transporter (DMT)-like permease